MKKTHCSDSDGSCESYKSAERADGPFCEDYLGTKEDRIVGREEKEGSEDRVPGALHLRPCTWEDFFELEQEGEDKYDFVEGVLVSRLGLGWDNAHTNIANRIVQLVSHV